MAKEKKASTKVSAAEVARRVGEILRIRLDGAQFHDIVQFVADQKWELKERQIYNYIRRADDLLVERQEKKRKRVVGLHLAKRQALYARAVNAGDYRTALAIADSEAKLRGLFPESGARELARMLTEQSKIIVELEGCLARYKHPEAESEEERQTLETPSGGDGGDASGE